MNRKVRAGGGAARSQRAAVPSAQELLGLIGSRPVAAAEAEYGGRQNIIDEFYAPKKYKNMAGEALAPDANSEYYYIDANGDYVDGSAYRQSYDIDDETGELIVPGMKGPQEDGGTAAAQLTVVPTSSSNTKRPRTVAAGYDSERQVLTVVFRDGSWYNYYEVTKLEWSGFKAIVSKGKYIYSILDFKPRGPATVSGMSAQHRKTLYGLARAGQIGMRKKNYGTGKIN